MVARSLRVSRATFSMVAAFTAAVAANAMLSLQLLNGFGQAVVFALVFFFVAVIGIALVVDIFSRSNQAVATLRTLGATKGTVSRPLLVNLLMSGGAGCVAGAVLGGALGAGLGVYGLVPVQGAATGTAGTVVNAILVVVLSLAAMSLGTYMGVRRAWPS